MKNVVHFYLLCIIIGIQANNVYARLDAYQYHLTENLERPVRWENVEGSPEIVHGKRPLYSSHNDMHVLVLEPCEESFIRLPAHEKLRFVSVNSNDKLSDINASISYGNHLFCHMPLKKM